MQNLKIIKITVSLKIKIKEKTLFKWFRGIGRRGFPPTVDPRHGGLGAVPPEADGYFKTLW